MIDTEDIPFEPSEKAEDGKAFDYGQAQAAFMQKQAKLLEERQKEVIEQYEAKVEGRPIPKPTSEEEQPLVINGIEIPPLTPSQPEYLIEQVPVEDATGVGLVNMPFQSSKMFQKMKRPNPNYVSREMRNAMILKAQMAMATVNGTHKANGVSEENTVGQYEGKISFMDRVSMVQKQLESHEDIIGFEMKDGHLVITLE